MDILNLVNKLDDLIVESKHVPLTNNIIVEEGKLIDILEAMRVSIPEEIQRSKHVIAQRDQIIAQAREEYDRTIESAKEKSQQLISSSEITKDATRRAEQILTSAHNEAEMIRREADKYTLESLKRLEVEMERSINQVRNGIRKIQQEQGLDPDAEP